MYIVASPDDSKLFYPQNRWKQFTLVLPRIINNAANKYQVALTHVYYTPEERDRDSSQTLNYVFSPICESSVVKGGDQDLLGIYSQAGAIDQPLYHNIAQNTIQRIPFTVTSPQLNGPVIRSKNIIFVLHFREKT